MEKRNSQLEHRQPMKQTGCLFCTWDSDVDRFWRYALFRAKRPGCLVSLFSDTQVFVSVCHCALCSAQNI